MLFWHKNCYFYFGAKFVILQITNSILARKLLFFKFYFGVKIVILYFWHENCYCAEFASIKYSVITTTSEQVNNSS